VSPLVSIVIPAYNAEPYVAETLRSALAQTWPRTEVVVVNDGSRDGTPAATRAFAGPRVKVIDQENRGAAAARNRGLREAQGEFVQFLDADDLLAPDKVEVQVRRLADLPDCVAAGRWGRFATDPARARFTPEPFWRDLTPADWLTACWERHSMMHPAGWLTPRAVADRAGRWDETLSLDDDGEFFARVVLASAGVLFCADAVSYYRSCLPSSLSGSKSDAAWASGFRAADRSAKHLLACENSPRTRRACSRLFEEFVYACYPAVPALCGRAWARAKELGGPYFQPPMGPKMRAVSRVLGWKAAKRLQQWVSRHAPGRRLGHAADSA
jgi:glycosyltransferase involved in cell wall biosynthesis